MTSTLFSDYKLRFSTVHGQFRSIAMERPDAVALVQGTDMLTYAELLQRALAFASSSIAQGVCKGSLVALDASRTTDTIVAILGILFAGGTYVPVQSCEIATAPLLSRHGISFLATDSCMAKSAPGLCILPTAWEPTQKASPFFDMPGEECGLEDPAYVLFTSGSTGARKGVVVPHRAILRLVNDQTFMSMSSDERMLLHSPLTFDASTLELWSPLLHGGTVVLAPERPLAVEDFRGLIPQHRITSLWLTSGIFHLITQHAPDTFSTLRHLIVGGDVIQASLFATVKQRYPRLRLVNGYGPTENTTFTTCFLAPVGFSEAKVPIGEPIAGTSVCVLDEAGLPVPEGTPGELAAGGLGVALGYLNDASLTATRFARGLTGGHKDEVLYLTGDMVRRRQDGQLEFLGRKDSEIKLAGQRVQLDDVERAICNSSSVLACAILAVDEGADKFLVAFVVWRAEEAEEELRTALKESLPLVAIPRVVRSIEVLPLTENGKVDRTQLRVHFLDEASAKKIGQRPPSADDCPQWNAVTESLWCRLLHRDSIEPHLNFFDVGGDSLGLILMQAELQKLTPHAPTIVEVFSLPTVKSIAEFISRAERAAEIEEQSGAPTESSELAAAGRRY